MKIMRLWALSLLFLVIVSAFPVEAMDQDSRFWRVMHADSFPPTPEAAMEQCLQAVGLDQSDRLTADKCFSLAEKLESGVCQETMVIDGRIYDFLGMLRRGQPTVEVGPWVKSLGRNDDIALQCELGDGVTADFYIGEERSCGNLAIRFEEVVPPLVVVTLPEPKKPVEEKKKETSSTTFRRQHETASLTFRSGFLIQNCGGGVIFVPGLLMQSGGESDKQTTTFFQ